MSLTITKLRGAESGLIVNTLFIYSFIYLLLYAFVFNVTVFYICNLYFEHLYVRPFVHRSIPSHSNYYI